jgi:regulator of protease activity HflC (stomatin/prohibitin superfamily)
MPEDYNTDHLSDHTQLTQAKVPFEDAADAFSTRDASGKIPIVIIPKHLNRIRNDLVAAALLIIIGGIVASILLTDSGWIAAVATPIGLILLALGVYRSFIVRIPEGTNALLTRGGRYVRTEDPGTHFLPPWVLVSHMVTQREIPFDIPVVDAPTRDNVRCGVDTLVTFAITDAFKFVYSISASDFDQVFQAACQDALRGLIRNVDALEIADLMRNDLTYLRESISNNIEPYGVSIRKVNIVFAQPPDAFMHSLESQQLAVFQRQEQIERQTLALQRQHDEQELAYKDLVAKIERANEELRVRKQKAGAQSTVFSLEADAEDLRLQRLQQRLEKYPDAAAYDVGSAKLEIARSLAGNTRAVLQVGEADDIVKAFVLKDVMPDFREIGQPAEPPSAETQPSPAAQPEQESAEPAKKQGRRIVSKE